MRLHTFNKENLPGLSYLLVCLNEENYIKEAMEAALAQDYPQNRFELLIIDGGSTDRTLEIIEEVRKNYQGRNIRFFNNKNEILASGWNIGLKKASYEVVIRPDVHAMVPTDFVRKSVKALLSEDGLAGAGGLCLARCPSGGYWTRACYVLYRSPFALGGGTFRFGKKRKYVTTLAFAAYWRNIFEDVGYFNESLKRNQDLEFHQRVLKKGYRLLFEPQIYSEYYCRSSFRKLLSQAYKNGFWNTITIRSLHLRHLVPLFFVLFLFIMLLLGMIWPLAIVLGVITLTTYMMCAFIASFVSANRNGWFFFPVLPIMFLMYHITYGIGSLIGIFTGHTKRRKIHAYCLHLHKKGIPS